MEPYQDLIDREQIESTEPNPAIVKRKLTGARNKLGVAQKLAKSDSESERREGHAIAYQAALVALEAWMRHKGYKKTKSAGHVAVLNFARRSLGSEHHKTIGKLHRMKTDRHNIEYVDASVTVSRKKAKQGIDLARSIIDLVHNQITGQERMDLE